MVQLLVVEDEKIERETMVQILKNKLEDIQVDSAKNGIEAIQKTNIKQYDLVFVDINMPGMNGLDMIREIRTTQPTLKFLILTSYNYFEYAQEAIRLGVADFILKPYNIEEFIGIVKKQMEDIQVNAHKSIEQMKKLIPIIERDVLFAIISNASEIELYQQMKRLDKKYSTGFCFLLHDSSQHNNEMQQVCSSFKSFGYCCLCETIHEETVCFILHHTPFEDKQIEELYACLHILETTHLLGVGPIVHKITEYHHSYQMARNHLGSSLSIQEQLLPKQMDALKITMEALCENVCTYFDTMDEDTLKQQVKIISDCLIKQDKQIVEKNVQEFYTRLLNQVTKQYPSISFESISLLPFYAREFLYQDLPLNLTLNLKKIAHRIEDERYHNTNHFVKDALIYIEQNYTKQIVLADLADYLKISPFYISKLLSASLHKSFTELVSEKRVEASKVLLKRDEPIKAIAIKVGFQGQSYFNKIFKKYTGVTPKVYRLRMK